MWEREEDFLKLLERGIAKATKSSINDIVAMAIGEEKWGYKHVVGLLKKAMMKNKKDRINVFYIISNICRTSRSQLGSKDKYAQRFLPLLPSIAKLLAEASAEDLGQAEKVLQTWQRDSIFPSEALSEFEAILRKDSAIAASRNNKRKAEKAPLVEAPPAPSVDVAIDFGSTFEDIALPPPPAVFPPSGVSSSSNLPAPPALEHPARKARGAPAAKPPVPSGSSPQLVEIEDAMRRAREMAARFMANASKDAAAQLHSASAEASSGPPPPPPPPPPPQAPPSRWAGPPAAPTLQPLKGPLVHDQQSHMPAPPQPQPGPGPPPAIPGPRPPPGSPPRPWMGTSQPPPPPLPPVTLPAPAAPPAGPPPLTAWTGAPSAEQHPNTGAFPGLRPPPPPLPPLEPPGPASALPPPPEDKASDEEWWTTVTSTLPNLDGVMSPS
ncbi:hypothetical protein WJX75_002587 [Coccomyxa subellipsoidea]|uniref:CID domain-containing protein n=1 Tax=Coccomyxa subellipsoidea TaxID=248742 RepID=A0ABR2YRS5_9CHLO